MTGNISSVRPSDLVNALTAKAVPTAEVFLNCGKLDKVTVFLTVFFEVVTCRNQKTVR